jgi:hypothetical protein
MQIRHLSLTIATERNLLTVFRGFGGLSRDPSGEGYDQRPKSEVARRVRTSQGRSVRRAQWAVHSRRRSSVAHPTGSHTSPHELPLVHFHPMNRRLLAIALILATIFQGPALVYAATVGASMGDAITHACAGQRLTGGSDCQSCCTHGAMPSCSALCPVPVSAAVLLSPPTTQRPALCGIIVPDLGIGPFAEHDPPHPLRPPIV